MQNVLGGYARLETRATVHLGRFVARGRVSMKHEDKTASMLQLLTRAEKAEAELARVREKLAKSEEAYQCEIERYDHLVAEHRMVVERVARRAAEICLNAPSVLDWTALRIDDVVAQTMREGGE